MRHALRLHPDHVCSAVTAIDVDVGRPHAAHLALRYVVEGAIGALRIPAAAEPGRSDGLWRHSCFEAFVRPAGTASYLEVNVAPSLRWAVYAFDSYRSGMRPATPAGAPRIEVDRGERRLEVEALVDFDGVLPPDACWRLGLSAVIEELDGRLSYWALAHPPGKADFHHEDCFALELPAARQS